MSGYVCVQCKETCLEAISCFPLKIKLRTTESWMTDNITGMLPEGNALSGRNWMYFFYTTSFQVAGKIYVRPIDATPSGRLGSLRPQESLTSLVGNVAKFPFRSPSGPRATTSSTNSGIKSCFQPSISTYIHTDPSAEAHEQLPPMSLQSHTST